MVSVRACAYRSTSGAIGCIGNACVFSLSTMQKVIIFYLFVVLFTWKFAVLLTCKFVVLLIYKFVVLFMCKFAPIEL